MKITSLRWFGAVLTMAFGGVVLVPGCMTEARPGEVAGIAEEEGVARAEQVRQHVDCGPPGSTDGKCIGRCCSHQDWQGFGYPPIGQCSAEVTKFCADKGGNCGACWGYLDYY